MTSTSSVGQLTKTLTPAFIHSPINTSSLVLPSLNIRDSGRGAYGWEGLSKQSTSSSTSSTSTSDNNSNNTDTSTDDEAQIDYFKPTQFYLTLCSGSIYMIDKLTGRKIRSIEQGVDDITKVEQGGEEDLGGDEVDLTLTHFCALSPSSHLLVSTNALHSLIFYDLHGPPRSFLTTQTPTPNTTKDGFVEVHKHKQAEANVKPQPPSYTGLHGLGPTLKTRVLTRTHTQPITSLFFHSSSLLLGSTSLDGTFKIWDCNRGYCTHNVAIDNCGALTFGRFLDLPGRPAAVIVVVSNMKGDIYVIDLKPPSAITEGKVLPAGARIIAKLVGGHVGEVTGIDVCASGGSGSVLVTGGKDEVLNFWDLDSILTQRGKATGNSKKRKADVSTMVPNWNPIATQPVYEGLMGVVALSTSDVDPSGLIKLPLSNNDAVKVKNYHLTTAGSLGVVKLWAFTSAFDVATGLTNVQGLKVLTQEDKADASGDALLSGGYLSMKYNVMIRVERGVEVVRGEVVVVHGNGEVGEIDVRVRKGKGGANEGYGCLKRMRSIVGRNDEILDVRIIPNYGEVDEYNVALATSSSLTPALFNTTTFNTSPFPSTHAHKNTILSLSLSPNGKLLATASKDHTFKVWSTQGKRKCLAVGEGHVESVLSVSFSAKGSSYKKEGGGVGAFLVSAGADKTLKRWALPRELAVYDAENDNDDDNDDDKLIKLKCVTSVKASEKDINIVTVSPNDTLVASGGGTKTIKLWQFDIATSTVAFANRGEMSGHKRTVWDLVFSAFDKILLSSSGDKTVKIWNLSSMKCVRTMQGHSGGVLRTRFVNNGMQVLTAGAEGIIKLWSVRDGEEKGSFDMHFDKVWGLDVSTDSEGKTFVVSAGGDSRIVGWIDNSVEGEKVKRDEEDRVILKTQELGNAVRNGDLTKALEIGLDLDKPLKVLEVIQRILEASNTESESSFRAGEAQLKLHAKTWSSAKVTQILRYVREWSTRAKNSAVAMQVLKVIILTIGVNRLVAMDGVPEILAGVVGYGERHFERLERLVEGGWVVDYCLEGMGGLIPSLTDDEGGKKKAEDESIILNGLQMKYVAKGEKEENFYNGDEEQEQEIFVKAGDKVTFKAGVKMEGGVEIVGGDSSDEDEDEGDEGGGEDVVMEDVDNDDSGSGSDSDSD